jgi:two-component system nitrate/nitrite response regulator NarL
MLRTSSGVLAYGHELSCPYSGALRKVNDQLIVGTSKDALTGMVASVASESEIAYLFKRLLNLICSARARSATHRVMRDGGGTEELQREEIVAEIEYGGMHYKLVRLAPSCTQATLSPREQEIVRLVSSGHPNKTIAHKLAISQHTVNTHVRRIFLKLGVNSRAEMVAFALQTGLVPRQTRYY